MKEMTPAEAHRALTSDPAAIYVDVRTPGEYDQGHPEGAWNLPVMLAGGLGMRPNADFVGVAQRALPKDALLIVGCKSGQRSAMACQLLEQAGFSRTVNVAGGFLGGMSARGPVPGRMPSGLPTSAAPTPGRSWSELAKAP